MRIQLEYTLQALKNQGERAQTCASKRCGWSLSADVPRKSPYETANHTWFWGAEIVVLAGKDVKG